MTSNKSTKMNGHTSLSKKSAEVQGFARPASESMLLNFFALFRGFYGVDFPEFLRNHRRLYQEALRSGDHGPVTAHYYSVMSGVIEQFYGGSFNFVPPAHKHQSRSEASHGLHQRIATLLNLGVGKTCVDVGCGIGAAMADVAQWSGAKLTGVTVSPNEVARGKALMEASGVGWLCGLVEGDANALPLPSASCDAAYAVYALKYFSSLAPVFGELERVLRAGGLFLVYDLVTTPSYDAGNERYRELVEGLEYACGMPALHSIAEMRSAAEAAGLRQLAQIDLSGKAGLPWYHTFSRSALFMWLVESRAVYWLIRLLEVFRLIPEGFADFNDLCMAGTVRKLVRAGEAGILSGSTVLVFQKLPQLAALDDADD